MASDAGIGRMLRTSLPDVDWGEVERHLRDTSGDTFWPSFVSGVALGGLIGALVALVLAPRTGRNTRRQVWETTIELRSRAPKLRAGPGEEVSETLADEAAQAEIEMVRRLEPPQ
jgi:hypothetical protein